MATREFTREQLEEMGVPYEWDAEPGKEAEILRERQTDTRRWVSWHECLFRAPDDGKVYAVEYQQGLTEQQDGTDLWDEEDTVTAVEMESYEITVTEWREVAA
jgi:hypothetical protein